MIRVRANNKGPARVVSRNTASRAMTPSISKASPDNSLDNKAKAVSRSKASRAKASNPGNRDSAKKVSRSSAAAPNRKGKPDSRSW